MIQMKEFKVPTLLKVLWQYFKSSSRCVVRINCLSESYIRDKAFPRPHLNTINILALYNLHQKYNYLLGERGNTDDTSPPPTNSTVDTKESTSVLVPKKREMQN
jgi:hypothetical protein